MNEWKIIEDQQGIDELMKTFVGFHDSCITSLAYESGLFVDQRGAMAMGAPNGFALRMVLQSQWQPRTIELCFSGVRSFHVVGLQDNYMNDIYDAYLAFHEGILPAKYGASSRVIVWADWADFDLAHMPDPLEEPGTSYVIAETLRWRIVEE